MHRISTWLAGAVFLAQLAPGLAQAQSGQWIPTNDGGADAEVRESLPDTARGSLTEIASRIVDNCTPPGCTDDSRDRNSMIYLRFDLSAVDDAAPGYLTKLRLTYRDRNLSVGRVRDDEGNLTGMTFYGLDPEASGAAWDEATITYNNAPGITPDGDIGTVDIDEDELSLLGDQTFPDPATSTEFNPNLPVGGEFVFESEALDAFVRKALKNGYKYLTIVAIRSHDGTVTYQNWLNFNYLFNPKEQTTLNDDPTSPFGTDNTSGEFSPSLYVEALPATPVPAMSWYGLLAMAGLLALLGGLQQRRRRR
jgi:hypothetical protein